MKRIKSIFILVVFTVLVSACSSEPVDAVKNEMTQDSIAFTAGEMAVGYMEALQRGDFDFIWSHSRYYRDEVRAIQSRYAKTLWRKKISEKKEESKADKAHKQYISYWQEHLKNASITLIETRLINGGMAKVFVEAAYPKNKPFYFCDVQDGRCYNIFLTHYVVEVYIVEGVYEVEDVIVTAYSENEIVSGM